MKETLKKLNANNISDNEHELSAILLTLKNDLSVEIIWSAMKSILQGQTHSIKQALEYGHSEWDK